MKMISNLKNKTTLVQTKPECTAMLQSHVYVFIKSRHGKKQGVAQGSGGEVREEAETWEATWDQPWHVSIRFRKL